MIQRLISRNLMVATAFIAVSCSKKNNEICDPAADKTVISSDLAGRWNWVRMDGGIGYHIHDTPASTGKNIELVLTANNKYSFYINGILSSEGTYSLPVRTCIHDNAGKKLIDFSSPEDIDIMVEGIENNVLSLSDENYDGTLSQYKRN